MLRLGDSGALEDEVVDAMNPGVARRHFDDLPVLPDKHQ